MRKPTIKDVAKQAGVSLMTVSRTINQEESVREVTRQRVLKAVDELGYEPDVTARSLRGTQSFAIGLAYDDNPNANYVLSMQKGVLAACRERGYELLIHPYDASAPRLVEELCKLARNVRLAGLVLTPPMSEDPALLSQLQAANIPFVRIIAARQEPDDGMPCVYVDDHSAAYAITAHLIQLGHTRIAFLWGDPQYHSSPERYQGYADALRDHGIPLRKKFVLPGTYVYEDGFRRARKLLAAKEVPTAIFGSNDEIAAGVLAAAHSIGIKVPGELSIAGFEDNPFSRRAWPALTTARQTTSEIGRHATLRLIAELLQKIPPGDPIQIRFTPELVIRDSTAPPQTNPTRNNSPA